jgi:hypothetical protein
MPLPVPQSLIFCWCVSPTPRDHKEKELTRHPSNEDVRHLLCHLHVGIGNNGPGLVFAR